MSRERTLDAMFCWYSPTFENTIRFVLIEPACNVVRAAPKEKNMKRTISIWLGLLALALLPALAQTPAATPTGKLHGHVTNPTGAPQSGGTVSLILTTRAASRPGLSAQTTNKEVLNVDTNGDYKGDVTPGIYTLIYRTPGMEQ